MTKRGLLIVIDGTDGSGKTTQTELLVERLRAAGQAVETISFPRYDCSACGAIKAYLAGEYGTASEVGPYAASVLYAVDRFDARRQIKAWLDAGKIVVANRYVSSNMGHQGGKIADREQRAAFYRWEDEFEFELMGLPRPDLSIILHAPAEIGMALAAKRDGSAGSDIHQADLGHLKAAEQAYLDLATAFPGHFWLVECAPDGKLLPSAEIAKMVWELVTPQLR